MPAIDAGMKRQLAQVRAIADNPAAPTFDNTPVALEKNGRMLNRTMMVFKALTGANTDPTLQKVQEEEAPRLAAHRDAIFLNPRLSRAPRRSTTSATGSSWPPNPGGW